MIILSLDDFFADIAIANVTAELDNNTTNEQTGSGTQSRSSYGTRLWMGTVNLTITDHERADEVSAKIQYLQEADLRFRVAPAWRLTQTATTGTLTAIDGTDRRRVQLSTAQPQGSIFGVVSAGGIRSMHRVAMREGAIHIVVPSLPLAMAANDTVTFNRPEIDAILTSANIAGYRPVLSGSASFTWEQTY